ncbi:MAG: metallophosphatase domain-containing protein [Planctomycetota bacterium]
MKIRVVTASDTHQKHQHLQVPDGDIFIHAGDFTNRGSLESVKEFNTFLGSLPHRYKIIIAGNHDLCFESKNAEARALITNAIYLQDEGITIEGIHFYGSPWQPWFFSWAFNLKKPEELRQKWDLIPTHTNILITHGPPFGYGDRTLRGDQVGCKELLKRVEILKPKYHIFGHIHEGAGQFQSTDTTFINASSCNFGYKPVNPPIVFDYTVP